MEDPGDPHFKRERPVGHAHHPAMHMPAGETQHPHTYHHPAPPGSQMQQQWAPAPSPYGDGAEQRAPDHAPPQQQQPPPPPPPPTQQQQPQHHHHHHHQQQAQQHPPPPASYPPQGYPPTATHAQPPVYASDSGYGRANSISGPTRSPSSAHNSHYPPHSINGASHPPPQHQVAPVQPPPPPPPPPAVSEAYYPRPDYNRQQYPPPESPASGPPLTPLHVQTTAHEMMPAQPQTQGPPSGYPPPHSSVPPHAYWAQQADWLGQQRRKPVRAAQACDSCRQRKAKCDEGRPECSHCRENGMRCTYRDVPPQKQEKQMLQINEKVEGLSDEIKLQAHKLNDIQGLLQTLIERQALDVKQNAPSVSDHGGNSVSGGGVLMTKSRSRPHNRDEIKFENHVGVNTHTELNGMFMDGPDRDSARIPDLVETPAKLERGVGAPVGASELLVWPAIRELVPKDIPTTYLMDIEVNRGLIRLYGCGEGEDRGDGHDGAPSPAPSLSSGRMDEDASTASPSGVWGTGQLPQREGSNQPVYDHPGGVTPAGQLLLDCTAVETYVRSYLKRMHILHPFLDTRVLRKMVNTFKAKHSWDYHPVGRMAPSITAGMKRKREMSGSPGSTLEDPALHSVPHHNGVRPAARHAQIEHSISNAIILLVIALGKICAHEDPLPAPPKSGSRRSASRIVRQQPELGYGDLPPVQLPPPSSAPASPFNHHTNGVSPSPTSNAMQGRNIDVIPGLAYFAKAADILGELPGGVDVSHVQANLLAGLYMGQLARVIPSHWYITTACRACQLLIRSTDYLEKRMSPDRRNLINFAFWSCLQLESDILAEMNIPSSGIVSKEASMIMEVPNSLTMITDDGKDETEAPRALRHYSNQIQLRRTLNDAVVFIYNTDREQAKPSKLIETLGQNLESWRELLKDWDWDDEDHQTGDILHARMRAKYYGAKYIISRPALQYALSLPEPGTPMSRPSESPAGNSAVSDTTSPAFAHQPLSAGVRQTSGMGPPTSIRTSNMDQYIIDACRTCVQAAIRSTTSFDRVPKRLVTTNILGTAHAQFGNVLVLAATYSSRNPSLIGLVSRDVIQALLERTISFLDDKANISPTLAKDAEILRHVQQKLFPMGGALGPSANSSFSSNR